MTKVIRLYRTGGPEELALEDIALGAPGLGEVRVRQQAIGLNYVDIYHRIGLYPLPKLPAVLGVEAAGIVEAVGADVADFVAGDRVAYALPVGAYSEARLLPASRLFKVPAAIAIETAAGAMLRGLTAHMLLDRGHPVAAGGTILVHAAAGGLGLILTQWAKQKGITTIGTVGSEAKAALARSCGLDHAILYKRDDFVAKVRDLTSGRGVDLAIDGVGGETLVKTLDCVRPFGAIASVGQASCGLPTIALSDLGPGRALSLSRPSVFRLAADLAFYRQGGAAVFAMLEAGLKIETGMRFALADVVRAHRALEAGETSGSPLLLA
jgi:NADPH:quinone reductase